MGGSYREGVARTRTDAPLVKLHRIQTFLELL